MLRRITRLTTPLAFSARTAVPAPLFVRAFASLAKESAEPVQQFRRVVHDHQFDTDSSDVAADAPASNAANNTEDSEFLSDGIPDVAAPPRKRRTGASASSEEPAAAEQRDMFASEQGQEDGTTDSDEMMDAQDFDAQETKKLRGGRYADPDVLIVRGNKRSKPYRPVSPWLKPPKVYVREVDELGRAWGMGKRKSSHARVCIAPGTGNALVNKIPLVEYFKRISDRAALTHPLEACGGLGRFDIWFNVHGGGTTGQTGACQLALSKALQRYDPQLREALRTAKLVKPDLRQVERKKAGLKKARRAHQWVKR